MTVSEPPDEQPSEDDTTLLIAVLNQAWAIYDAEINRGLQLVNYFLVAIAVLATAYIGAINGKHYAIAAVLALVGLAITTVVLIQGLRQREMAYPPNVMVRELYGRVSRRLKIESIPVSRAQPGNRLGPIAVPTLFALAFVLDIGALMYAVAQ